jgi:ribosome-associated toxin RatA of RatAB toxin-antitoxin module
MVEREIEIDAPLETVFRVISDLEKYPEFLSTTKEVVMRPTAEGVEADFSIQVIKPIRYTLKFRMDPPRSLQWEFVRGELMKTNSGGWKLEKLSDSKTKAFYCVDATFGWMVPKALVEQVTKLQLPEMLQAFKLRAEEMAKRV